MQPEPSASIAEGDAPPAGSPGSRRLSILHLTLLVAAAAVTFAAWPFVSSLEAPPGVAPSPVIRLVPCLVLTGCFWSPVVAAILLAGPAAHRREAAKSYGTAAVVAIAAAAAWLAAQALGGEAVRQQLPEPEWSVSSTSRLGLARLVFPADDCYYSPAAATLIEGSSAAACTVLAAWATLALTGAGRRPSGLLEWSSFAFGLAWVASQALNGVVANALGPDRFSHMFFIAFSDSFIIMF